MTSPAATSEPVPASGDAGGRQRVGYRQASDAYRASAKLVEPASKTASEPYQATAEPIAATTAPRTAGVTASPAATQSAAAVAPAAAEVTVDTEPLLPELHLYGSGDWIEQLFADSAIPATFADGVTDDTRRAAFPALDRSGPAAADPADDERTERQRERDTAVQ